MLWRFHSDPACVSEQLKQTVTVLFAEKSFCLMLFTNTGSLGIQYIVITAMIIVYHVIKKLKVGPVSELMCTI